MKQYDLLIVDDEQRYADMLAKRLGLRSLTCKVCYDGRTAIEIIKREPFPVVILDLRLPDIYGTEVLTRIKQCRPETAVIILTGHGSEKDREQCMAHGAHSFINKPLEIDRLLAMVARIKESAS
jgi:DNA-binding NtrC family response regulator